MSGGKKDAQISRAEPARGEVVPFHCDPLYSNSIAGIRRYDYALIAARPMVRQQKDRRLDRGAPTHPRDVLVGGMAFGIHRPYSCANLAKLDSARPMNVVAIPGGTP